jgi:hypothetical protein
MLRTALACAIVALYAQSLSAQDERAPAAALAAAVVPAPLAGTIDSVTVYRGQAMVTRRVDVPAGQGPRELVVSGLPDRVVVGSIYAEPVGELLAVRSVTYRVRPVSQDVRDEVRKLDADIVGTQDAATANARMSQLLGERKTFIQQLEQFSAPTATAELKHGVLNAETLKALTLFLIDQRQQIAAAELKLAIEQREIGERATLLQRQRNELTGGSARSLREAVVFVDAPPAGGQVRLRYLVDGATWSPSYNVRAGEDRKAIAVEYNAAVEQMSGEDWSNVAMTLSTATPSLVAAAPRLDPLAISLAPIGEEEQAVLSKEYQAKRKDLLERRRGAESARSNKASMRQMQQLDGRMSAMDAANMPATSAVRGPQGQDDDSVLNSYADELQKLEFAAKGPGKAGEGWGGGAGMGNPSEQTVSVTYQLPGRTSLPSRSDRQLIQIASVPMAGNFYKLAVPVLTTSVYEQASLTNVGQTVLLAGPVSSYLGGQFVGAGQIPTVAVGETFTVGFGIDSSLRATRELIDKVETVQGGNKVLTFDYRLSVENFGTAPATVRLIDRVPTSTDPSVRITRVSSTVEPSKDESYTDAERKQGILRWDVEAAPAAIGAKSVVVGHQYRIEHDRQMTIGAPAAQ